MMMNHRYILFTGLMVTALCIHAQDIELQTKEKYEYADATQLWRRTLNPAGLSLDTLTNRGISYFEFSHQQGTHYRVQDGDEQNKLLFTSERYQKLGNISTDTGVLPLTWDGNSTVHGATYCVATTPILTFRKLHQRKVRLPELRPLGSVSHSAYQKLHFRRTTGL